MFLCITSSNHMYFYSRVQTVGKRCSPKISIGPTAFLLYTAVFIFQLSTAYFCTDGTVSVPGITIIRSLNIPGDQLPQQTGVGEETDVAYLVLCATLRFKLGINALIILPSVPLACQLEIYY